MQSLMISKHSDNIDAFDLKLDMNMDIYSVLYRNIFNSNKILIFIRTAAYQKSICHISILYGSNSPKREFTAFKWEILPLKMRSNGRQKCNLKSVKGYSPTS